MFSQRNEIIGLRAITRFRSAASAHVARFFFEFCRMPILANSFASVLVNRANTIKAVNVSVDSDGGDLSAATIEFAHVRRLNPQRGNRRAIYRNVRRVRHPNVNLLRVAPRLRCVCERSVSRKPTEPRQAGKPNRPLESSTGKNGTGLVTKRVFSAVGIRRVYRSRRDNFKYLSF